MQTDFIAGIGGANVDLHGQSDGPFILRDSNPGRLHLSAGGVLRNILENLARLGHSCQIFTAIGDDVYGQMLRDGCQAVGMGTDGMQVRRGHSTSSYISILDDAGDMLMAMCDIRVLDTLGTDFIAQSLPMLNAARLVVCDANLSAKALEYLALHCTAPLYIDPVSTAKATRLLPVLGRFDTIKPNRIEMEVLAGMPIANDADLETACCRVLAQGVRRVFVSLGENGIYYKGQGEALHRTSRQFDQICNATGAGDATMAGIVHASLAGYTEEQTLQFALGAGLVALSGADTINPSISETAILAMIKEYIL